MTVSQISAYVLFAASFSGVVLYAENEYAKRGYVDRALIQQEIRQAQDRINYLRYLESQGKLTPDQRWQLEYYKDKQRNLGR